MAIPPQKQNNYEIAFKKVAELLRRADLDAVCGYTGAEKREGGLAVRYFSRELVINHPDVEFRQPCPGLWEQILVLHYLTTTAGYPVKEELAQFHHLPGAMAYRPAFRKRSEERLVAVFGAEPERLIAAGERLGGSAGEVGDISVSIPVFPKVAITAVMYRGDDEFPPDAKLFFNDTIINHLPLEDIAVLAGILSSRLIKSAAKRCAAGVESKPV